MKDDDRLPFIPPDDYPLRRKRKPRLRRPGGQFRAKPKWEFVRWLEHGCALYRIHTKAVPPVDPSPPEAA